MNFKILTMITAFGSLINSAFYLLAPVFSLMLLGQTAGSIGLLNTRAAGAIALGMAAINWLSRNIQEPSLQRIVIIGNLIMFSILTIIEIAATLNGTLNWVGWLFTIADGFLTLGFVLLLKKNMG